VDERQQQQPPARVEPRGARTEEAAPDRVSYVQVLRIPGAMRAFLPVVLGRAGLAMVTLATLLAVQDATGSFALAGATTGVLGLTNVLSSPIKARAIDRFGRSRTLPPLALAYAAGLLAMMAAIASGAPDATLIAVAAVTGLLPPPLGAAMRVVWASLTPDRRMRTRAFSLDSVSEDLAFTFGPLLVSASIIWAHPAAAVVATAALVVVATAGLVTAPASRGIGARPGSGGARAGRAGRSDGTRGRRAPRSAAPLRQPHFALMLVVMVTLGILLGTVEVSTAAFADQRAGTSLAGVLLACFAAGSCIGGLLYGAQGWRSRLRTRLLLLTLIVAASAGVLALAAQPIVFGITIAIVGFFLGPALVSGYLVADETTSAEVRTEASAWVSTAVNAGVSLAAVLVGAAVDVMDRSVALAVPAAAALLVAAAVSRPMLRRGRGAADR
jgi:predicted MFS family arabinose efflux permease